MRKGFTLIELVVAVAILGVITIIAIPAVSYIQRDNKDTKYEAYSKAINTAGKLYTDSYTVDLFGPHGTGCAIITYEELKDKDLIEDIQVKDVNCGSEDTFVMVRKNKKENYNYETHTTCRQNGKVVYGDEATASLKDLCKLEDASGPEASIADKSDNPNKPIYKKNQTPKVEVTIEDNGTGLQEKQTLNYQWYQDDVKIGESQVLNFNNKYWENTISKEIQNPTEMSSIVESADFKVVVTGTLEDMDGNKSTINRELVVKYRILTVKITFNANDGILADPHLSDITLASNGDVLYKGSNVAMKFPYEEELASGGLWDWNNSSWLNLTRNGFLIKSGQEWNTEPDGTGKTYNHADQYKGSDFCSGDVETCDVKLYANWTHGPGKVKIHYNVNGAKWADKYNKDYTIDSSTGIILYKGNPATTYANYGENLNTNGNATLADYNNSKYINLTRSGYKMTAGSEWINKDCSIKKYCNKVYDQAKAYAGSDFCDASQGDCTVTLHANWKKINKVTIKYNVDGGKLSTSNTHYSIESSTGLIKYDSGYATTTINYGESTSTSGLVDCNNANYINIVKTGYKATSSAEWINKATGKKYNQATVYSAAQFCDASKQDCTVTLHVNWKRVYDVHIKYSVNGGTLAPKHHKDISIKNDRVYYNGKELVTTVPYTDQVTASNLWNYNNPDYLNVTRSGYHAVVKQEWYKTSGSTVAFDQNAATPASKFCNASSADCTILIYIKWVKNCSVSDTSNCNQMFFCDNGGYPPSNVKGITNYRSSCNVNSSSNIIGTKKFKTKVYVLGKTSDSKCWRVVVDSKERYVPTECLRDVSLINDIGGAGNSSAEQRGKGRCDFECKQ
ncbi:MAG: prepilin-type N-terminal cleavage/methylation domain-containing protein [Bacilli bacterium]|nr:prepilin-type N-terminal cleavage/methylation domain-containing protein [Bacilli bacterium]